MDSDARSGTGEDFPAEESDGPDGPDGPEDSAVLLAAALGSAEALARLRMILSAEFGPALPDADDAEQDVWLRMLEHLAAGGSPVSPSRWLRTAAREVRAGAGVRHERENPGRRAPAPPHPSPLPPYPPRVTRSAEQLVVEAELRRALRATVPRLPGRCPGLVGALLDQPPATYRELAEELGISQGSIGPLRSRCLACLRRLLVAQGCTGPLSG